MAELAQMLVSAENPVIVTSRSARTPAGLQHLVELAETLGYSEETRIGALRTAAPSAIEQSYVNHRKAMRLRGAFTCSQT